MPTNRPFFANFLAAFRAHSNPTFKASSSSPSSATSPQGLAATAHVSTTTTHATPSNPRSITTKTTGSSSTPTATTLTSPSVNPSISAAANAAASAHHLHAQPLPRSPGVSTPLSPHNMSMSPPGTSTPIHRGRQRRGSDSSNSSGGFMDALGPEKWYIGGRTAGGEEKFYRLGLVTSSSGRRVRSLDRLSL